MANQTITADMLPGLLADLARITTTEIAIAVARRHGGRRLYIPAQLPDQHPLADLVGRPAAMLIVQQLGGDRYNVPAARTILRWSDAHRLRRQGYSHSQISAALGITQQYVAELLAGAPIGLVEAAKQAKAKRIDDRRQMSLF